MSSYNERTLVEGLKRGEAQAQAALLEMYGEPILRFLIAVCHLDPTDAEDVAVETLYRAIERIDSFSELGTNQNAFRNWLFTIGRNLWRDKLRKSQRLVCIEEIDYRLVPVGQEREQQAEVTQAVQQALQSLPDSQRRTLLLHYGGLQLKEVADILNESPSKVRQWKKRGIAKLTELLIQHPALKHLANIDTPTRISGDIEK